MRKATAFFVILGAALAQDASPAAPAASDVERLARLLRLEDLRVATPAAWAALEGAAADDAAWKARVALAKKRVFEDPFAETPRAVDGEALVRAYSAEHDDVDALQVAAHDLARFPGRLPKSAAEPLRARLGHPDPEVAGFTARALARVEGAGEAEASAIVAAALNGGGRLAQIDRLRALATLPGGPARPAILAAMTAGDPHLRRTACETAAAVAGTLPDRDRKGLARLAETISANDPEHDVRAAAADAFAALDRRAFLAAADGYRFAAPWPVRAVAARRFATFASLDPEALAPDFGADPDRRVRQAALEAWADVAARKDAAAFAVARARAASLAPECDPVAVGLQARIRRALWDSKRETDRAALAAFLERARAAIPVHDVEPLQDLVRLADAFGGEEGTATLVALASAPHVERDVFARARAALERRGKPAPPAAEVDPEGVDLAPYLEAARRALDPTPITARVTTDRGVLTFRMRPDVAPLTVRRFAALARAKFYDGLLFHRVVPGFVAQAGCPRGDGWGGSAETLRCETSASPYMRGTLGMALAGKDTGGSQWFVTHRRTPHLEGKYTVFGELVDGFDALDALVQGDRIRSVVVDG
ncbi:MAG TPA: peptidylprolyl isomerase [Planctomycetota bacterium]|nr:peptidylprolyl isomerase [Planctomycetota bacterium]